jgi:RNA polymerase sigma factor FliA
MLAPSLGAQTRSTLVEQHLPMARMIAIRLKRRYGWIDLDELYSYSLYGLTAAARAWQPDRGVTFGVFAGQKALYLAVDEMRRDRLLRREKSKAALEVSAASQADSANQEWDPVDTRGHHALRQLEARDVVENMMFCLPPHDRQLLQMYYGDELTLAEIGEVLGLTESAVCLRHKGLLARLRRRLVVGLGQERGQA